MSSFWWGAAAGFTVCFLVYGPISYHWYRRYWTLRRLAGMRELSIRGPVSDATLSQCEGLLRGGKIVPMPDCSPRKCSQPKGDA